MFKFIFFAALVACVAALDDDVHAEVLKQINDVDAEGFTHQLETSNGIFQEAHGYGGGKIDGSYSYVSPEGETITVIYNADEGGYKPASNHLPTPPPIPAAILKSLEYLKTHAPKEESKH